MKLHEKKIYFIISSIFFIPFLYFHWVLCCSFCRCWQVKFSQMKPFNGFKQNPSVGKHGRASGVPRQRISGLILGMWWDLWGVTGIFMFSQICQQRCLQQIYSGRVQAIHMQKTSAGHSCVITATIPCCFMT